MLKSNATGSEKLSLVEKEFNKNDGKRRNTLGYLDQYPSNMLRLWNSQDRETV